MTNIPVTTIAKTLLEKDIEAVVVLDEEGHALGVVGRDELISAYGRENYSDLTAEDILREGVPQIPPDIPLNAAAQMLRDKGIRAFFLMHHAGGIEYPAALISYKHFLRHIAMEDPDDIKDMGISADRETPLTSFFERRDAKKRNLEPISENDKGEYKNDN
jgi:predicted transcriptional regulator